MEDMAQPNSMKQIGSRNMGYTVERMEWSNKMDLIAIGNDKGEVILQRLNWQKVFTFPPPAEEVKVRSLSWHHDQPILAVGYSNGTLALLDIEREDVVCTTEYDEDIKRVFFTKPVLCYDYRLLFRNVEEFPPSHFLPKLPPISEVGAENRSNKTGAFDKNSVSFLGVVMPSGKAHFLLLGALKVGTLDLREHVTNPDDFDVYDVQMNGTYTGVYALVRDDDELKLLFFGNEALKNGPSPLLHLSSLCTSISDIKIYMNEAIQCVLEAWETILIEMDNKLTKYANSQPEGSLSADFLELLLFGYATHEVEEFLMEELTEKGLKKLANSVDLSFSTMQGLVTKQLHCATVNLFYYLTVIKGLSRIIPIFENYIEEKVVEEALRCCGQFLMKLQELQQIIDQSVNDMKLFFSWLLGVIVRLHQQDGEDITQLAPDVTIYLAEYLNSFEDSNVKNADGSVVRRKFNLEKIGQYLENKNLHQIAKTDKHQLWNKLLEENKCLRNCKYIYANEKHASLIQQRDKMFEQIDALFKKPGESISSGFVLQSSILLRTLSPIDVMEAESFVSSSYLVNNTNPEEPFDIFITTTSTHEAFFIEFTTDRSLWRCKCLRIDLRPEPLALNISTALQSLRFVDIKMYNLTTISLLLQQTDVEKVHTFFVQLPINALKRGGTSCLISDVVNVERVIEKRSIHNLIEGEYFKMLDGEFDKLAVSGARKVAALLSDYNRKMTIFEMEVEDDEEDAELSQSSILEISKESM